MTAPLKQKKDPRVGANVLAASSCIGVAVAVFNPLDCWRIRWQVQSEYTSMPLHLRSILRNEGLLRGLWLPGIGSNMVGAAVSRGIGLGCYPAIRDTLVGSEGKKGGASMFAAGLVSGGIGYGISTPAWQLKTRLQAGLESTPLYRNLLDGTITIVKEEGVLGLYRGCSALIVRGALMNAGNTLGYDLTKTMCKSGTPMIPEGPVLHFVASVVAAFLSSTFSVPADFVMTRFQSAHQMGRSYPGVLSCCTTLLREEGPRAFFRGWTPLFVRVAPLYVLFLPAYEQVRRALGLGYFD